MKASSDHEFPLLSALGLYASDIRGDGNCLFNALSDQIYGHQNQHHAIRARVIEYMREHAAYYKQFIDVNPGGGIRRNPKRKNAGAYSSPANFLPPSSSDIDRVFEGHLQSMARGGTYGDNLEITAFSNAFNVDVKIYQRDFAFVVSGTGDSQTRPVAHIAYHMWEHYSSIRNLEGPHSGLPEVQPKALSLEEEQSHKDKLAQTSPVLPWQVDVVSASLPFLADKPTIKRALEDARGDVNLAVDRLLTAEENGSTSSQQESSSIERDHDSDDDMHDGPNKKQDRRMSRATRSHRARSEQRRHALSQITAYDGSQESLSSWASEQSSARESSQPTDSLELPPANGDAALKSEDSGSRSESPAKPKIRFKLHPPRPPDPSQRVGKSSVKQNGPRLTARDRKDIKKQAQKAARKERQQAAARPSESPAQAGIALRQNGLTETPPLDTMRTLYI